MGIREIEEFCRIDEPTRAFLQKAIESLSLSARAAHRPLRAARMIADLAGSDNVQLEHVAAAVQYQAGKGHASGGENLRNGKPGVNGIRRPPVREAERLVVSE